jgi:predicted O-methyltransferase YrrM
MDEIDRLLAQVKESARGMLSLPAYRRIYETAAACGGGTIVEIGIAQGAATIALALGAKQAGRPFRIVTADPFAIDSRRSVGSVEDNLDLVRRGYETFGVADAIEIVVGTVADLVASADPRDISLLLIDADGRIDREIALLHDRLAPACPIIIDDMDGAIYLHRVGRRLSVDQKHRITLLLIERFAAEGLLVPQEIVGQTGWYVKGPASRSSDEILRIALPAYRELTRATIGRDQIGPAARRLVARRAPGLVRAWRRLRPAPPLKDS